MIYHSTLRHQHETTAHALVTALALLAIDPDEQERVHAHIMSTVGDREIVSQADPIASLQLPIYVHPGI